MTLYIPLAMCIAFAAASARAAEPAEVFSAMGITGTWSPACDQPASRQNPRVTFSAQPDGTLTARTDTGPDGTSLTTITQAAGQPGGELEATSFAAFNNLPKQMRDAMMQDNSRSDITSRSVYSTQPAGTLTLRSRVVRLGVVEGEATLVADGMVLDPSTHQPVGRVSTNHRCPP